MEHAALVAVFVTPSLKSTTRDRSDQHRENPLPARSYNFEAKGGYASQKHFAAAVGVCATLGRH